MDQHAIRGVQFIRRIQLPRAYWFPVLLLVCNVAAAVVYAASGDWKRAIYWLASSVCIAAITF
jgi:hypothetical protein